MKNLSTIKFDNFSRTTTFILMVFPKEVIWKTQKIQFRIISIDGFQTASRNMIFTGGFLGEQPENWFSQAVF